MATQYAPSSMYRSREGMGIWEHRGKVAAVGVGHSPTERRWDERPETSVGAWSILALRNAIADAGVAPDQVDGIVIVPQTTTGAFWPEDKPLPQDVINAFVQTDDPLDGVAKLSVEWLLKNMPELTNINYSLYAPVCMSNALNVAAQVVGDGESVFAGDFVVGERHFVESEDLLLLVETLTGEDYSSDAIASMIS